MNTPLRSPTSIDPCYVQKLHMQTIPSTSLEKLKKCLKKRGEK